jgi:hypothetical protein
LDCALRYSNDSKIDHVAALLPFPKLKKKDVQHMKDAAKAKAGEDKEKAKTGEDKEKAKAGEAGGASTAGGAAAAGDDSDDEFADAEEAEDDEFDEEEGGGKKQEGASAAAAGAEAGEKEEDEDEDEDEDDPYWFVWTLQMPDYAPAVFGGATDGVGFTVIMYYKVPKHVHAQLKGDVDCESNWARLVKKFMHSPCEDIDAETKQIHERLKLICRLPDPTMMGSWKSYNAKPMLTRPQHRFYKVSQHL